MPKKKTEQKNDQYTCHKSDQAAKQTLSDEEVRAWLCRMFVREPSILCDRIREAAAEKGISRIQLRRIRRALGVKTWHQFDEGGATENWFWKLDVKPASIAANNPGLREECE